MKKVLTLKGASIYSFNSLKASSKKKNSEIMEDVIYALHEYAVKTRKGMELARAEKGLNETHLDFLMKKYSPLKKGKNGKPKILPVDISEETVEKLDYLKEISVGNYSYVARTAIGFLEMLAEQAGREIFYTYKNNEDSTQSLYVVGFHG